MTLTLALTLTLTICAGAFAADAKRDPLRARWNNTILATWQCQDHLGGPATRTPVHYSPWKPHTKAFKAAQLAKWQARWRDCSWKLKEKKRQWNWQAWLPDKWRRIGVCETGLNWFHANSSYVSAFGIWIGIYDSDAARKGVRPWYVRGKGPPTPWEQYQAALGHYERFGGFSGWGCRGA